MIRRALKWFFGDNNYLFEKTLIIIFLGPAFLAALVWAYGRSIWDYLHGA